MIKGLNEEQSSFISDYFFDEYDAIIDNDDQLLNWIRSSNILYKLDRDERRWWDTFTAIVNINGRYFGFEWASANRDESVLDLGYVPVDEVYEYKAVPVESVRWEMVKNE